MFITTSRLCLRPYVTSDVEQVFALTSDPTVREFVGNLPETLEGSWSRILRSAGHWSIFAYGSFAVVERDTGQLIGEVGAGHFHRGVDERLDHLPEASWLFRQESHGKGYALEAMSALVEWMEARPDHPGLACLIDPVNRSSLKLGERLGFKIQGDVPYRNRMFQLLTR